VKEEPVEAIIESIRVAVAADATAEARAAGVVACRTILAALEPKPSEPLATPTITNASPVATAIAALRGMPTEQLFELAIAKLRTMVPDGATVARAVPIQFKFVPCPGVKP
jgi:hypothetical protein